MSDRCGICREPVVEGAFVLFTPTGKKRTFHEACYALRSDGIQNAARRERVPKNTRKPD